jgi:hypothetical protein
MIRPSLRNPSSIWTSVGLCWTVLPAASWSGLYSHGHTSVTQAIQGRLSPLLHSLHSWIISLVLTFSRPLRMSFPCDLVGFTYRREHLFHDRGALWPSWHAYSVEGFRVSCGWRSFNVWFWCVRRVFWFILPWVSGFLRTLCEWWGLSHGFGSCTSNTFAACQAYLWRSWGCCHTDRASLLTSYPFTCPVPCRIAWAPPHSTPSLWWSWGLSSFPAVP